jgi:8-oxo-dGTP diphosphatase
MAAPQFGDPAPGLTYADRPAAFGIAERGGRIAVVAIDKGAKGAWTDLPGGALDAGETAAEAVVREFGEETGLVVEAGPAYANADQRFVNTDGSPFNNRGTFFQLTVRGEAPELKIEHDHTLQWLAPEAALRVLRHDAHAWAVAAWLRSRAPTPLSAI